MLLIPVREVSRVVETRLDRLGALSGVSLVLMNQCR